MSSATLTVEGPNIPCETGWRNNPCVPCNLPDTLINAIAAQNQGENYLTPQQRTAIETEIISSDVPGNRGMNAKKIGDIWLCRMLVNTWAILFTQWAFERPFKAIPWQLRMHGFGG